MPTACLIDGQPATAIDALDRGLMYGDGVFRTMRARNGLIPDWSRQWRKLLHDCSRLGISAPDDSAVQHDIARLLADARNCVLKIVVTRGSGGRGYSPAGALSPRRIVTASPLPPHADHGSGGVTVRWCATRLALQPRLAGVKHLNRLENVLARSEWQDPSIAEGLMLSLAGHVIGGTMTNLFLVEGEGLVTPELGASGVAGVQRDRAMDAAAREGVECRVEAISVQQLMAADAVVLTNSVIGLWWVAQLGDRRWEKAALVARMQSWLERNDA